MSERLLRSAATGDTAALEELIREQAPSVHRFLVGMLGDVEEAEAAAQETFVRLARSVSRYRSGTDPDAWVFGIARRVAADMRPTPSATPPAPGPADDEVEWARRALRALPLEHRELLVARELMRWDDERIAEVFEITPEEIPHSLTQAREAMLVQTEPGMR